MPKRRSLSLDDATPQMKEVVRWCHLHGLTARRTSAIQIKVGPFNAWPDAGTWNRDDDLKRKTTIRDFKSAVERWARQEGIWTESVGEEIVI